MKPNPDPLTEIKKKIDADLEKLRDDTFTITLAFAEKHGMPLPVAMEFSDLLIDMYERGQWEAAQNFKNIALAAFKDVMNEIAINALFEQMTPNGQPS
jgi:hypothetical protein